jgi:signal transduction histidine kinase/DNA-binding response OmpR family regulator/ligand-binding sensor domain-containing protein
VNKLKGFILLILISLATNCTFAFQQSTPPVLKTKYISIEDGLSHSFVTSIYQDSYGFIWIGTFDGLNRFNGYELNVYRHQPKDTTSLANNRIESIHSHNEKVFVGTKKGLNIYSYSTDDFSQGYFTREGDKKLLPISYPVTEIKGRKNKIFVGTAGQGLLVRNFENQGEHFKTIPLETDNEDLLDYHAQAIEFDSEGKLWVFVQGIGITSFNSNTGKLQIEYSGFLSGHSMVFGKGYELWIGLDNGVLKYNTEKKNHQLFVKNMGVEVKELMYLKDSKQVWAATDGNGLLIWTEEKDYFDSPDRQSIGPEVIKSNSIYSLFLDDEERKWIGTKGGVNLILNENRQFKTISKRNVSGLPSNFISSFEEKSRFELWIGTDGEGLSLFNRDTNSFTNYVANPNDSTSLSSNFITSLKLKQKGLWIGTYGGGVDFFNPISGKFKNYPLYNPLLDTYVNNIWVLFEDKSNRLWAAASNQEGLYNYNSKDDKFEYTHTDITGILSIAQQKKKEFWIGTYNTLYQFDLNDGIKSFYSVGYPIRSIKIVTEKEILIGTEGGGLILLDTYSKEQHVYTQKEGLSNNSILSILEDEDGYFWLSTNNGISRFDLRKKKFINYYADDGLQSNQFSYNASLKLSNGDLVFGGVRGFNFIAPNIDITESEFPKLLITQIKINNIPLSEYGKNSYSLNKIELPYDKSMLSLEYVALEYGSPQKISYAYFLEGWDREWHYVEGSRMANYSKLSEGDYIFHLKSTNSDGVWNEETLSFPIQIQPPWYRTTVAYILYFLIFTLIIYAIINFQKRQSRLKYDMELSRQLARQEKKLNEKKFSFFTNISHEIRSPLTMIINPLKDILYGKEKEIDPEAIEMVYHNSRRLLSLVDQLMLFRKVDSDTGDFRFRKFDIVHLCKEVYTCFVHKAKTKEIDYSFSSKVPALNIYVDKQKIEIALFNLISNALKFTDRNKGIVKVTFTELANDVVIEVSDNGQKISEAEKDRIFELFYQSNHNNTNKGNGFGIGLYLVNQIIRKHGGVVVCDESNMNGNRFRIKLRKGKEHLEDNKIIEKPTLEDSFLNEVKDPEKEERTHVIAETPEFSSKNIVVTKKRILVIDDNVQIRSYLGKILSDSFIVTEAPNAEMALEILKERKFDFILCDVIMDKMNGVEFCKIVKNDDNLQHIPIILLTAGTSEELKLTGVEVGADDYITKPFDKNYLKARIHGILRRREVVEDHFMRKVTNTHSDIKLSENDKIFLDKVVETIEMNLGNNDFNVKNMSKDVGMSQSLIYKKIKQLTGKSISEFMRFVRLRRVATLLITSDIQINQAAINSGFGDLKYFRKQFKQQYKMTPSNFRRKYENIKDKKYVLNKDFINE